MVAPRAAQNAAAQPIDALAEQYLGLRAPAPRERNRSATGHARTNGTSPQDQPRELELELQELNEAYAVVIVGEHVEVFEELTGPDGEPDWRRLSIPAFREWLRPRVHYSFGQRVPLSKRWLEWNRRRAFAGIVFDPSGRAPASYLNLWRGFAVKPDPRGVNGCARFIEHVAENVCSGDEQLFNWVMGWFAQMVQQPTHRLGTSLVLRGPQGAGKSIVGEAIGSLLWPHYKQVAEERYLTGRFNSHLASCLLLQLEEATWGGNHAVTAKLRDLITNQSQLIEYKGREPIPVRNHVRIMVTGNNRWLVPAGLEERRFAVIDVGERQLQNHAYFAKLLEELDAGGRGALLHYLLSFSLDGISLREIPETAALVEQKLASLSPEQKWWLDILARGELPGDRAGVAHVSTKALQDHYVDRLQKMGFQRRGSETELGRFLRDVAPGLTRKRITMQAPGKIGRPMTYVFPSLEECRRAFQRLVRSGNDDLFDTSVSEWQACGLDSS